MEKISFLKIRKVKSPVRANQFDAGIDFFVPLFDKEFIRDLKEKNKELFYNVKEDEKGTTGNSIVTNSSTLSLSGNTQPKQSIDYELNDNNDTFIKFDEKKGLNYFLLPPHQRILIPSGIKSRMNGKIKKGESASALIAFNKSGVATKYGLDVLACVVDQTYQGEIHLSLVNSSTKMVRIYEDMKIVQFIEMPIFTREIELITPEEIANGDVIAAAEIFYLDMDKDRGSGGFGSSNKK